MELKNKVAVVTGVSKGLGLEIVKLLLEKGTIVAGWGRNQPDFTHPHFHFFSCDVADEAQVAKAYTDTVAALGEDIRILVNNAGFTRDMLALRMGDADWNAVLEVDLTAPFRLARAALRGMMKKRQGRIISIASIVGVTGNAGQANYAAAKAGLIGMSKSLAQEVATRGVTVNVVAPGFVKTAMTDALNDAQKTALLTRIPTQRMGSPEDIAAAVVYLASNEAGWVTGQTLHVNGGMAMI